MRIFITGGSGFIGSHLADLLLTNHHVTIFDNMSSSVRTHTENSQGITINGDIRDSALLEHSMKDHDVVIAMAAAHLRVSLNDPVSVHDVNATGTLMTLRAAKHVGIKRVVYISSSEVYGSATNNVMSEDHNINPTTIYGASKYVGELYTNQFSQFDGLQATIIRPFNTYGPRSHFDGFYGEVIPRMTIRVLNGESPLIFGDGTQTRDFTFVSDTIQGIADATFSSKTIGQTINIAYGQEIPVNTIAEIICREINPSITPQYKKARPQDVQRHAADVKKAKKLIQWKPKISTETGIKKYITWLKKMYPDVSTIRKAIPDTNW